MAHLKTLCLALRPKDFLLSPPTPQSLTVFLLYICHLYLKIFFLRLEFLVTVLFSYQPFHDIHYSLVCIVSEETSTVVTFVSLCVMCLFLPWATLKGFKGFDLDVSCCGFLLSYL